MNRKKLSLGGWRRPGAWQERGTEVARQVRMSNTSYKKIIVVDLCSLHQIFGMASETSVRSMVDLILVRKSFSSFNFYYNNRQLCLSIVMDKVGINIVYK